MIHLFLVYQGEHRPVAVGRGPFATDAEADAAEARVRKDYGFTGDKAGGCNVFRLTHAGPLPVGLCLAVGFHPDGFATPAVMTRPVTPGVDDWLYRQLDATVYVTARPVNDQSIAARELQGRPHYYLRDEGGLPPHYTHQPDRRRATLFPAAAAYRVLARVRAKRDGYEFGVEQS